MITPYRTASGVRGLTLAGLLMTAGLAGPASAQTVVGAEFERVTADIRAAIERHDSRAYHEFRNQLDELIITSTRK